MFSTPRDSKVKTFVGLRGDFLTRGFRLLLLLLEVNWELWFPLLELPPPSFILNLSLLNLCVSVFLCSCRTGPGPDYSARRADSADKGAAAAAAASLCSLTFSFFALCFSILPYSAQTFIPRRRQGGRKTHHPAEKRPDARSATNGAELCATTRRFSWKKVNPECVRHVPPAELLHTAEFLSGERRGSGRLHGCSLQQGFSYCW